MRRAELIEWLAARVLEVKRAHPVRVVIDGVSASGKTTLADDLAEHLGASGREVIRARLDDFKRPWSERHSYDRESGEGYYRNAYDCDLIRSVLLEPLGRGGSRAYLASSIDPLTQQRATDTTGIAADDAILVADGVFALRPELRERWDLSVFLDLDFETVLQRGAERDQSWAGSWEDAAELYRSRYIPSEEIYLREAQPVEGADVVVDQRDFANPRIVKPANAEPTC